MEYTVYIVKCADKTYYTGIASDIKKRITEHNKGEKGAKYTRSRRPVKLVYKEEVKDRSEAQKREYQIRQLTRSEKETLISSE